MFDTIQLWSATKNRIEGDYAGMIVNTGKNYNSILPYEAPNKVFFDAMVSRYSNRTNITEIQSLYGVSEERMLLTRRIVRLKGYNHIFEVFLEKQKGEINKQELKILNAIDEGLGKLVRDYSKIEEINYQDKRLLDLLPYI